MSPRKIFITHNCRKKVEFSISILKKYCKKKIGGYKYHILDSDSTIQEHLIRIRNQLDGQCWYYIGILTGVGGDWIKGLHKFKPWSLGVPQFNLRE